MLVAPMAAMAKNTPAEKYRILVSKNSETLLLIKIDVKKEEVVLRSPISFGGEKTVVGCYVADIPEELTTAQALSKEKGEPVYMAYCIRYKSGPVSGVCSHQGDFSENSHGCIRYPRQTSIAIFRKAYAGMVMEVVDDFKGKFANEPKADRDTVWIKSGVWKDEPTKHISDLFRVENPVDGGNKINLNAEAPVTLAIAAMVRGRSVIDSSLYKAGGMFEGLDPQVAAYIAALPYTKSGFVRFLNKEKGTDLFVFVSGDSSIWVSRDSVNKFMRELAIAHGEREDRMRIQPVF